MISVEYDTRSISIRRSLGFHFKERPIMSRRDQRIQPKKELLLGGDLKNRQQGARWYRIDPFLTKLFFEFL